MEQEIWKDVVGWEGIYKISNFGNVLKFKDEKWTEQSLYNHTRGYLFFIARKEEKSINMHSHVLVCEAFLGKRPSKKHVPDHIDENKLNNHVDNLQWLTNSENIKKAARTNKRTRYGKRSVIQKELDGTVVAIHLSMRGAAKTMGKNYHGSISNACNGILKTYLGYVWEYAD